MRGRGILINVDLSHIYLSRPVNDPNQFVDANNMVVGRDLLVDPNKVIGKVTLDHLSILIRDETGIGPPRPIGSGFFHPPIQSDNYIRSDIIPLDRLCHI